MKSIWFSKELMINKARLKSIEKLSELSNDQLDGIAEWFNKREPRKISQKPLMPEDIQLIHNLCYECRFDLEDITDFNDLILFITGKTYFYKDEINYIIDDIIDTQKIVADKEKIQKFFKSVIQNGFEFAKQKKISDYETRELPVLSALRYNVSLRLIPEQAFDPIDIQVESYKPKVEELIPVAIFEAVVNDGLRKSSINFQVNYSDLEDMIVKLQVCQKEMQLLENYSKEAGSRNSLS